MQLSELFIKYKTGSKTCQPIELVFIEVVLYNTLLCHILGHNSTLSLCVF